MATFFLLLSALCGMLTFGIHLRIMSPDHIDKPMYAYNPFLCAIPVISGLVLPVFSLIYVFSWHWIILFLINLVVVLICARPLGMIISFMVLRNKNLGYKAVYFLLTTIISMAIGITLHYLMD